MKKSQITSHAILTTVGRNRVGLVANVTEFIATFGGNIECQSCSRLGDVFATTTWFSASEPEMNEIAALMPNRLVDLNPQLIRMDAPPQKLAVSDDIIQCVLSVYCMEDTPAIVRRVTEFLAAKQIDITSLAAATYDAPFQGTPMFMMEAHLLVPHKQVLRWLSASIEAWEARFGWDMTLTVIAENERHQASQVPARAPFPPSRLFTNAPTTNDDEAYRVLMN